MKSKVFDIIVAVIILMAVIGLILGAVAISRQDKWQDAEKALIATIKAKEGLAYSYELKVTNFEVEFLELVGISENEKQYGFSCNVLSFDRGKIISSAYVYGTFTETGGGYVFDYYVK
jgi:hypothetical protein